MILDKLRRSRERGTYHTADLFAGCGGLTLGFDRAGFRPVLSVESDQDARSSHDLNFGQGPEEVPYASHEDVLRVSPTEAVAHLNGLEPKAAIDVVVGGPPCQAFSRLGRARLWELAGRKQAHRDDPRASLYEHFLAFVAELLPLAFVMENVREVGKFGGKNVAHEIAATAEELGYTTRYTILNAAWYGVPQLRERLIMIGIHRVIGTAPSFPPIECEYELPVGYSTSRSGSGRIDVLPPHDYYVDHATVIDKALRRAVTAAEAFADLPPITHHLDGRTGKGRPRDVDVPVRHLEGINSTFIDEMRHWPGLESNGHSTGHVIRYTPRDYEIFRRMPHGGQYPVALATAESIFAERLRALEQESGSPIEEGSPLWVELRRKSVPPYDVGRYPNKFRKMWPDHPARTLPAHLGKDSYSHIHFDSDQARCISLREAARLQSFPDAFRFCGSMNSRLRQIGNAVPPLMAYAIASSLKRDLDGTPDNAYPC